jgi:hypothetical protein
MVEMSLSGEETESVAVTDFLLVLIATDVLRDVCL